MPDHEHFRRAAVRHGDAPEAFHITPVQRGTARQRIAELEERLAAIFWDGQRVAGRRQALVEVTFIEHELLIAWRKVGALAAVFRWIRAAQVQTRWRQIFRFVTQTASGLKAR